MALRESFERESQREKQFVGVGRGARVRRVVTSLGFFYREFCVCKDQVLYLVKVCSYMSECMRVGCRLFQTQVYLQEKFS